MDTKQFRTFHCTKVKMHPHSPDLQHKGRSRNRVIYHFQQNGEHWWIMGEFRLIGYMHQQ